MRRVIICALGLLISGGCGADERTGSPTASIQFGATASSTVVGTDNASATTATRPNSAMQPADATQRKVIYTVHLDLYVNQFDGVQSQVDGLVRKYPGAYVAEA